jgi:uncharacterized protein (DUF342 family)
MLARLKRIPLFAKIAIGCLGVLLVCATAYLLQKMSQQSDRKQQEKLSYCCGLSPEYLESLKEQDQLDKDKAEYRQLEFALLQCEGQIGEARSKRAKQKYHQPECVATMRQVTTRGAQLEAEIQRLQSSLEADGQQSSPSSNGTSVEAPPQ